MKLSDIVPNTEAVQLGEAIEMANQDQPIVNIQGLTFLKAGVLVPKNGAETKYPYVYSKFGTEEGLGIGLTPATLAELTTDSGIFYLRVK